MSSIKNNQPRVVIAYGDGIGPEIMDAVLRILKQVNSKILISSVVLGEEAYRQGWVNGIKNSSWVDIKNSDVMLKAPLATPQGSGYRSVNVEIRKRLGLYANIRPVTSFKCIKSNFKNVDLVIIRENEEGLYSGIEYRRTDDMYECIKVSSKYAASRINRFAFEYCLNHNRKKITCMVKDNIMKMSDGIFYQEFNNIGSIEAYKEILKDKYLIDIGSATLATKPNNFDVIVTNNLYGDILSDIAGQVVGSIGIAGSANIGDNYALFEAVHGSAPDIAGTDTANPSALLNAALMMLRHLGFYRDADIIYQAWFKVIQDGIHTRDIFNPIKSSQEVGTKEFADCIISNLQYSRVSLDQTNNFFISHSKSMDSSKECTEEHKPITKDIGFDISIQYQFANFHEDCEKFITEIKEIELGQNRFFLCVLLCKGIKFWPDVEIDFKVDKYDIFCIRFALRDLMGAGMDNNDLLTILNFFHSKKISICKIDYLKTFDDKPGFFNNNY